MDITLLPGVINVVVNNGTSFGGSQAVTVTGSSATVTFGGIPTYQYEVQRSTNLVDWVTIYTTTAPSNGVITYTDDFSDLGGVPRPLHTIAPRTHNLKLRTINEYENKTNIGNNGRIDGLGRRRIGTNQITTTSRSR